MANCPNCGSNHIQIKQESTVNWGRVLAGYALFGVVGGAVGAVTGEEKSANYCLDCGTSWKPKDLYKLLQLIEEYTEIKLNLARERDRRFMNDFTTKILPLIDDNMNTMKKVDIAFNIVKSRVDSGVTHIFLIYFTICSILILLPIFSFYFLVDLIKDGVLSFFLSLLIAAPLPFIIKLLFRQYSISIESVKENNTKLLEKAQFDYDMAKSECQNKLDKNIARLVKNY